jgi:hypothetical protein
MDRTRTRYSEKIKGDRGNFGWLARFDMTGGHLGITQFEGDAVNDRVLLSPAQVQELLDFVGKKPRATVKRS